MGYPIRDINGADQAGFMIAQGTIRRGKFMKYFLISSNDDNNFSEHIETWDYWMDYDHDS